MPYLWSQSAQPSERGWERFFDRGSLKRGRAYMQSGHVRNVEVKETAGYLELAAAVLGSEAEPYHVHVVAGLDARGRISHLSADCTCPMRISCKHAAALLFHYDAKRGPGAFEHRQEISEWLDALEKAKPDLVEGLLPETEVHPKRLQFILVPRKNALGLQFQIGSGNDWRLISGTEAARDPALAVEDVGLLMKLGGGYVPYGFEFNPVTGIPAFKLLLESGRACWKTPSASLHLGPPRPAEIVWTVDAFGNQRPTLKFYGCERLPFHDLWYFHEGTMTCGPLDTGLPAKVAKAVLDAPAIHAGEAPQVDLLIRRQFPGLNIPTIQPVEVRRVEGIKPVAHLHLFEFPNPRNSWTYNAPEVIPAAQFHFKYGDLEIPHVDSGKLFAKVENGVVIETIRDTAKENAFRTRIHSLGFYRLEAEVANNIKKQFKSAITLGPEPEDWFEFMTVDMPALIAAGWEITRDPSFKLEVAEASEWYSDAKEEGNDWFGVELGVMIDGKKVNLLPILQQYLQQNPFLEPDLKGDDTSSPIAIKLADGRLLAVPRERIQPIVGLLAELFNGEKLDKGGRLKLNKLRAAELPALENSQWRWKGSDELKELSRKLRDFKGIDVVTPSPNLQASLRPYQQEGLNWLQFLREYNLGGALADDMGLGKTVQALAHLLAEKDAGRMDRPSLVVAPTSLMANWRNEAAKFAPSLRTLVLHGLERRVHFQSVREYDLVVTSYALLPRDQGMLFEQEFHCLILDEAQYIKNPKTKFAQVACALKARHRLCLTGTPMENHLGELWSLFNFVLPGFLSDETRFRQAFRNPIEKHNDSARRKLLAHRIAPFVLRRRKEEVAKELPPKTEIVQNVELEGAQRDLYETIRLAMHQRVREEISKKGVSRSHIVILDALLKLRQVCCDPRLVPLELAKKVKQSAKLDLLMDLVPEMIAEGRRILLFSQFTSMLALIEEKFAEAKIDHVILTGETTDRATPIEQFQSGKVPVFLISLKAGGTGLNLTAADTVIHYDPWWNPAVENQATDRAHRIGQDKHVFVYKLITTGTVEEKIVAMQARKKALIAGLLDDGQAEKLQLTAEDLEVLFAPIQ